MDKPYGDRKGHNPSFLKNSSTGTHELVETKHLTEETDEVMTGGPSASSPFLASDKEIYARK